MSPKACESEGVARVLAFLEPVKITRRQTLLCSEEYSRTRIVALPVRYNTTSTPFNDANHAM